MIKIANAFSLNMLKHEGPVGLIVEPINTSQAQKLLTERFTSYVGHEDTARILSSLLGVEIQYNRASATLEPGDVLLVAQYRGPRLPEGATELPEGAEIRFYVVTLTDISYD
ncbi:MAG: DUF1874 domain-containing protein [Fervidicoccaceae archaeon]